MGNHEGVPVGHSSMIEVNKFLDHLSWRHRMVSGRDDDAHSHSLLLSKLSFVYTSFLVLSFKLNAFSFYSHFVPV